MKRTSQHVIDITQANFQEEVVAGSQRVPILVEMATRWLTRAVPSTGFDSH